MASSLTTSISTHDKLVRAHEAAARVAQFTTAEKNALLLAMADAIVANAASIIEANQKDLDTSGVSGAITAFVAVQPLIRNLGLITATHPQAASNSEYRQALEPSAELG